MRYDKAKQLAVIIIKIKLREASPEERERLFTWLDEREENRRVYKRIICGEGMGDHFRLEERFRQTVDFDRVTERIVRELVKRRRLTLFRRAITAAACVAGLAVSAYFLFQPVAPVVPPTLLGELRASEPRVKLVLPSGDQLNLENEFSHEVAFSTARFSNDREGLSLYEQEVAEGHVTGEPALAAAMLCRVVTSAGGQYHVVLQDGTEAWINAMSELEFPVSFATDRRVVRLKGEAFFNVAPRSGQPFIVESGDVATKVWGTSFNVHAYEEDETVAVTLLTGRVEVHVSEKTLQLQPGMEATWTWATGTLTSKAVHARDAVSWREGLFVFTGEKLETVMRTLARWHGLRFIYSDPGIKEILFTGRISMEEAVESALESITLAGGPRFRVADDVIYVLK
ncbi:MAG: FecR domain-containing protein [Odoribacteraceae bacterium]|jgi:ferric-dicitrate binding protein FerR (iron transport regulator)|nr:FecR domain-containing protein [Odoribacteraceae bacterium]